VEAKKTALIVTDGQVSVQKLADSIASALEDFAVSVVPAGAFKGTHILGAGLVFFGAEQANPPTFNYLHKVLRHINLVGRPCGVFSPASGEAVEYLINMVKDSELTLYGDAFSGGGDITGWARKVAVQFKS
jgi:hypothetical protein